MRNDWTVIINDKDLGLGFKNTFNADKSRFVEKTYKKDIFAHTNTEINKINELYGKAIERHFK